MKRGNKYGAVKTTVDGITFDSKAEAAFYQHLCLLQKAGRIGDFKRQCRYVLHAGIVYVADFVVYRDQQWIAVDVKGVETVVFKLKRKLYEEDYGPLDVVKPVYRGGVAMFNWPSPKEAKTKKSQK